MKQGDTFRSKDKNSNTRYIVIDKVYDGTLSAMKITKNGSIVNKGKGMARHPVKRVFKKTTIYKKYVPIKIKVSKNVKIYLRTPTRERRLL